MGKKKEKTAAFSNVQGFNLRNEESFWNRPSSSRCCWGLDRPGCIGDLARYDVRLKMTTARSRDSREFSAE
jgi:hypothetical protein